MRSSVSWIEEVKVLLSEKRSNWIEGTNKNSGCTDTTFFQTEYEYFFLSTHRYEYKVFPSTYTNWHSCVQLIGLALLKIGITNNFIRILD